MRGEALVALARQSPWLARRILAVTLFLMVLDWVAVVVMIIQPAPSKLLEDELAAIEIGMAEFLAHTEEILGRSRHRFLQARWTDGGLNRSRDQCPDRRDPPRCKNP